MMRFSRAMFGLTIFLSCTAQAQEGPMPEEMPLEAPAQGELLEDELGAGEQPEDPCIQQVTETENALADRMQAGDLSEETTDRIYELLDRADAECADGDVAAAEATLAEARAAAQ